MTATYATDGLADATARRDAARAAMNRARQGSRAWREAEEDLQFWIGKVAFFEVATRNVAEGRW